MKKVTEREYKHFLCYDQLCFPGIEYGETDLFFDLNKSTLFIKKIDHYVKSEKELEFHVKSEDINIVAELESFLITLMSYRYNFFGEPVFVKSSFFTKGQFEEMLNKGIKLMEEKDDLAVRLNADNELIKYCESIGLNPVPDGSSPTSWKANCLSGGEHFMMISTTSNEWGCGYCRKKGDINSLREWYENINKNI